MLLSQAMADLDRLGLDGEARAMFCMTTRAAPSVCRRRWTGEMCAEDDSSSSSATAARVGQFHLELLQRRATLPARNNPSTG